jgi:hypothetical protein
MPMAVPPALAGPDVPPPGTIPGGPCYHHHPHFFCRKVNSACWRHLQARFLGYPEEYIPQPLGRSLYAGNTNQVANGTAARMVLYDYDFVPGTGQLSQRGRDQVAKMSGLLATTPMPLVVERTPATPGLAEARRYAVLAELASGPYPVGSERVVIGTSQATGLRGVEAVIIDRTLRTRTASAGPPILVNPGVLVPQAVPLVETLSAGP